MRELLPGGEIDQIKPVSVSSGVTVIISRSAQLCALLSCMDIYHSVKPIWTVQYQLKGYFGTDGN